jgi:hypothetical protein
MWKNIRERVQKYDTRLTKNHGVKIFFTLICPAFQRFIEIAVKISIHQPPLFRGKSWTKVITLKMIRLQ